MPQTTPDALHNAAQALATRYHQLNQAKHPSHTTNTTPHGNHQPPGPQTPINLPALNQDHHHTTRLHEMLQDAASHLNPPPHLTHNGTQLCTTITTHAHALSQLDFATDLLDLLHHQHTAITDWLQHTGQLPLNPQNLKPTGTWVRAAQGARIATHTTGHPVNLRSIKYWAKTGKIRRRINAEGQRIYSADDIIRHTTTKPTGR